MNATVSVRASQLKATAALLLRMANELESEDSRQSQLVLSNDIRADALVFEGANAEKMLDAAIGTYKFRRQRKRHLNAELFGEPAWDLLLDLFIARLQNRKISVTSACIAADVPTTTGLRWLGLLEQSGMIERTENSQDQRVTWVRMSDATCRSMVELFSNQNGIVHVQIGGMEEFLISQEAHF